MLCIYVWMHACRAHHNTKSKGCFADFGKAERHGSLLLESRKPYCRGVGCFRAKVQSIRIAFINNSFSSESSYSCIRHTSSLRWHLIRTPSITRVARQKLVCWTRLFLSSSLDVANTVQKSFKMCWHVARPFAFIFALFLSWETIIIFKSHRYISMNL